MKIIMSDCAVWIASGSANEAIKCKSNEKSIPKLLSSKNCE